MSIHQNQRIHLIVAIIATIFTFLMRDNFTPINFGFDHSSLIVGMISIYFASRYFKIGNMEMAFGLIAISAIWIYVWMFTDRNARWDNCILVTSLIFGICVFFLSKNFSKYYTNNNFFGIAATLVISIIFIISSVNTFIKSDTNINSGAMPIYSDGRDPVEVDEKWVDANSYNRYLLSRGFMTLIFGAVAGRLGLQIIKDEASQRRCNM